MKVNRGCCGIVLFVALAAHAQPPELHVGYYPYHHKLRARANLGELPPAEPGAVARFVLTAEGSTNELATATARVVTNLPRRRTEPSPVSGRFVEAILDTPDLAAGNYIVTMTLGDAAPLRQTFTRTKWEWEHNDIGTSRVVVPPFTPLKVEGRTVEAVLRSHRINRFGLWDQVVSKGEPVLAAPIRLFATVRGRTHLNKNASSEANLLKWKSTAVAFDEKSPDRVVVTSAFRGGPIQAKVASEFD